MYEPLEQACAIDTHKMQGHNAWYLVAREINRDTLGIGDVGLFQKLSIEWHIYIYTYTHTHIYTHTHTHKHTHTDKQTDK